MQSQSGIWCYALTHDILVKSLKREGLSKDIILTAVLDSQLNARVIVDGNSRAVALAVMLREDRGVIGQLSGSEIQGADARADVHVSSCAIPL